MTRQQAIEAMKMGKKVKHDILFTDDEWIRMEADKLFDENGIELNADEFWDHRPDYNGWNEHWRVVVD